jgi:hypothetical protein
MQVLQINSVDDVQEASNGRKFRKVSFKAITYFGGMKITKNQKAIPRIMWDSFKDETSGKTFQADQLFLDLQSGEQGLGGAVEGQVVTFNTTPYQIGENQVHTYSCVVFSNENGYKVANNQLKQQKACVVDDEGNRTAPENLVNDSVTA